MRIALPAVLTCALLLPATADAKGRRELDPRDRALVELVDEASEAMVAAARGLEPHERWVHSSDSFGLRATGPSLAERLAAMGPGEPEILMTVLELEGVATAGTGPGHLRGSAVVLPGGELRWLAPSIRPTSPLSGATSGLREASPELAGALDRLAEALVAPGCELRLLTPEDVPEVPPPLLEPMPLEPQRLQQACVAAAEGGYQWKPSVDDVTVLVRVGAAHLALRSQFVVDGDRLLLDEVRGREVE